MRLLLKSIMARRIGSAADHKIPGSDVANKPIRVSGKHALMGRQAGYDMIFLLAPEALPISAHCSEPDFPSSPKQSAASNRTPGAASAKPIEFV
jgi:hypothetical protein